MINIDMFMDIARKEIENCDWFQGFQFAHSLSGGTGSGFGLLALTNLREQYPDRLMETMTVFQSENLSDTPVDWYNNALAIHHLVENVDAVYVVQNENIYNILHRKARITSPTFEDFNYTIAGQLSDMSSCIRFKSDQSMPI